MAYSMAHSTLRSTAISHISVLYNRSVITHIFSVIYQEWATGTGPRRCKSRRQDPRRGPGNVQGSWHGRRLRGIGQRLRGEAEYADGGPSYGPVGPSRPSKLRLEGSNRRRKEDGVSRPTPAYRAKPSPRRAGGMNYYYFSPIFNFFPTTGRIFSNPGHIVPIFYV